MAEYSMLGDAQEWEGMYPVLSAMMANNQQFQAPEPGSLARENEVPQLKPEITTKSSVSAPTTPRASAYNLRPLKSGQHQPMQNHQSDD